MPGEPPPEELRILIVEDNFDAQAALKIILELQGYQVLTAADGQEGWEALSRLAPDAAIIDVGLPKLNGYELAHRARDAGIRIPLVALTAYGRDADIHKAFAAGFDAHLTKPAYPLELLQTVRTLLEERATSGAGHSSGTGSNTSRRDGD